MYSELYERIKKICEEHGTTITAICVKVTGNKGNLTTWKGGNVRTDYLIGIAQELHCSTDYLLGIENQFEENEKRKQILDYFHELPNSDLEKAYKIAKISEGEE